MVKKADLFSKKPSSDDLHVIVERDAEGYLVGSVVELPGCHTQAKTIDGLMSRLKEAASLYIEVEGRPESSSQYVGTFQIPL